MMEYETIRVHHSGGASRVTFDRPPVNAVTVQLLEELLHALDELEARSETRCIVLAGAGNKAFSAGADMGDTRGQAHGNTRFRGLGRSALERIETHPKPVIAALRGWCIGGGFALAMACDVRIASTTARFRTGDAYIGVVPSWGMSLTRLVHYIGRNRTLDMLILGEDLSAEQAAALGLVTRVVADDAFDAEINRVAARVASGAPISFRAIKEAVRAQYWISPPAAQELETRWAELNDASHDAAEGKAAFRERRPPIFTGN
ncbi:MAG TPA: enoyl-CoA hydratase/isomerase family protein [Burkholderiales bacterium]|nr:enoyl-CoA hydratase/isomerase family protein [Burkholderiales bacterium]